MVSIFACNAAVHGQGGVITKTNTKAEEKESGAVKETLKVRAEENAPKGKGKDKPGTIFAGPIGKFPPLAPCELTYNVSWKDQIEGGQFTIKLGTTDDTIGVFATGSTVGVTGKLLPITGEFASLIDSKSLKTRAMSQTETRKNKALLSVVEIDRNTIQVQKRLNLGIVDGGIKLTSEYKSVYPVFDMVSAALFIRSQSLSEIGESYTLVVIPKSTPGPFTAALVGREKYKYQDKTAECLKLIVAPTRARWQMDEQKSSGENSPEERISKRDDQRETKNETISLTQEIKKRFRGAIGKCTVLVSDDDIRLPLKATIEIKPFGEISIDLVSFEIQTE